MNRRLGHVIAVVVATMLAGVAVSGSGTLAKRPIDPNHSTLSESAIAPMVACPEPRGWWEPAGNTVNLDAFALKYDSAGNLYAGGAFTNAGGNALNYVARLNGNAWSALSSGVGSWVRALASDTSGNLFVAGDFNTAGAVAASRIAKWDGTSWSTLGSGLNHYAQALAIDSQNNVYVGGAFTSAGGVTANGVAKWNPTTSIWSALGTGLNGNVRSMAVDSQNNVYVGGAFTSAGGVTANGVAKWNPTTSTWSALGTGLNGNVHSIAVDSQNNVYVAGAFTTAGGVTANQTAKWNSTTSTWSALGTELNSSPGAMALDEAHGLVYLVGGFTATASSPAVNLNGVTVWDMRLEQYVPFLSGCGGSQTTGLSSGVMSVTVKPQDSRTIAVGGGFTNAGVGGANRIATWNWGAPEPSSGQLVDNFTATTGGQVTFNGLGFIGVTGVRIGTTPVTNFTVVDPTTITMTVPSGLATGVPLNINVTAVGGTGAVATLTVPSPISIWRANLDPNGGTCRDGSITRSTSWTTVFVGYRYLPSAFDCTKPGHTFSGWARASTPTIVDTLPLLDDPIDSTKRYFLASNGDFVAVWNPTESAVPAPVVYATGSFFCRVCTHAVMFWQHPPNSPVDTTWTVTSDDGHTGSVGSIDTWRFAIVGELTPGSTRSFTVRAGSSAGNSTSTRVTVTLGND